MTTRYVGPGGNNGNDGLSWANRKLTLNGVEDTPVEAGDTVYVGAGTYRETLTCDVDGSSGSPITYIGDFTGEHTDGVGGEVRITASDDDSTYASRHGIVADKNYRTFEGFTIEASPELAGYYKFGLTSLNATYMIVRKCVFYWGFGGIDVVYSDTTPRTYLIENCVFIGGYYGIRIRATGGNVDNDLTTIQNCLFLGQRTNGYGVIVDYVGGVSINNCTFLFGDNGVSMSGHALTAGQHVTVKNSLFTHINNVALNGVASYTADITEDYNNFCFCYVARSNVDTGAHSTAAYHILDTRWAHKMMQGGKLLTPFDHAYYSRLVDVAGLSPTTTDIRGTATQGAKRELGALEYNSSLSIDIGIPRSRLLGGV